jgi:hypothetical protein
VLFSCFLKKRIYLLFMWYILKKSLLNVIAPSKLVTDLGSMFEVHRERRIGENDIPYITTITIQQHGQGHGKVLCIFYK